MHNLMTSAENRELNIATPVDLVTIELLPRMLGHPEETGDAKNVTVVRRHSVIVSAFLLSDLIEAIIAIMTTD